MPPSLHAGLSTEDHPVAALALGRVRTDEARVPSLWWFEVRNTLIVSERRGRLTESDTATFLHGLARLRVSVDRSPEEADVLALARYRGLRVYDAAYLELARREGAPLATLDAALATAARAVLAAVWQTHTGADRGSQHGFVFVTGELMAARLDAYLKSHSVR